MLIGNTTTSVNKFFSKEPKEVFFLPKMANRHLIISGQTGTGKTVSLRVFAEEFSKCGVPILVTDIKGDLHSISKLGKKIKGVAAEKFPVQFWDVFGNKGKKLQTSIESLGSMLLAKMLDLNATQASVLDVVFAVAEGARMKLINLNDVMATLNYLGTSYQKSEQKYGNIAPNSVGVLQRKIINLQREGGNEFFSLSNFCLDDFIKKKEDKGIINVLDAVELVKYPTLYSTFVLWILSKLYNELPEVGNLELPKAMFFIDEAHLLFSGTEKRLFEKIQQYVRLIRSKGVGIGFITQKPTDIPEAVLDQIGNKVQHGLMGFSPKSFSVMRAVAGGFPINPYIDTLAELGSLGTGEALVSFLDADGKPQPVEKIKVRMPYTRL